MLYQLVLCMNSNSRGFSMNPYIVDAHVHLSDPDYNSSYLDYILNYSKFTGTKLFSVSTGLHSSKRTLKLSHSNENIFAFVGIHPMSVLNENYESLETLARTSTSNFVGIGEIGLDISYAKDTSEYDLQLDVFRKQLDLAETLNKPVSIHSRNSLPAVLEILQQYNLPNVLLHWFSGNEKEINYVMDRGYFVSFGPSTVYSKKSQNISSHVNRDLLLIETDGPVRYSACFQRNITLPSLLPSVIFVLSNVHQIDFDEMCNIISENSFKYIGHKL